MRRTLLALFLTPALGLAAEEPKKADPQKAETKAEAKAEPAVPPAEQFKELKKAVADARTQYGKDLKATKDKDEQTKISKEYQAKHKKQAKEALELAKANLTADFAFDALALATQDNATDAEATKLAVETFADDARILQLVPMLQYKRDGAKTLAKLADSKHKDVRGTVRFQQLSMAVDEIESPRNAKTQADADKAFTEVSAKLVSLSAEYGNVTLGKGPRAKTVADAVKDVQYAIDHLVVGKTLPDVEAGLLDGDKKVRVSDLRGKVVVLDIWATWCGPCRAMIPHEKEMVEHLKDKPFALVSVSADDSKETLTKFLEKTEMPWTHWYAGPTGKMMDTYQIRYFPTIYVLDAKGVIRHKNIRDQELEAAVKKLLAETDGAQ